MSKINYTAAAAVATSGLIAVHVSFTRFEPGRGKKQTGNYTYLARETDNVSPGDYVMVPVKMNTIDEISDFIDMSDNYAEGIKFVRVTDVKPAATLDIYSVKDYRFIFGKIDVETQKANHLKLLEISEQLKSRQQVNAQQAALAMLGLTAPVSFETGLPAPVPAPVPTHQGYAQPAGGAVPTEQFSDQTQS